MRNKYSTAQDFQNMQQEIAFVGQFYANKMIVLNLPKEIKLVFVRFRDQLRDQITTTETVFE